MSLRIPIEPGLTNFDFEIELDAVLFNFSVYWNDRESHWYFDLRNEDLEPLILGAKLVLNYDMLQDYNDVTFPAGAIYYIRETKDAIETADNLGIDYNIYYFTEAELG